MAGSGSDRPGDRTAAELAERAAAQAARLVRQEIEQVRDEVRDKAVTAGTGAALLGGAGVLAAYGTGAVVAGAVAALETRMPRWAAGLTVGGGLLSAAGALGLAGRRELRRALPLVPERSAERVKADAQDLIDHVTG